MGETKKDLMESLQKDIELTSNNYAEMHDRLRRRDGATRFFITYYSVVAILFSLIPLFLSEKIVHRAEFDFLTISASIIVLVASLLVSFAKYSERALHAVNALDALKRMKKELVKYTADDLSQKDFEKYNYYIEAYHQVVDCMELRANIDYYRTCKKLKDKNNEYKNRWEMLSFFSRLYARVSTIVHYIVCAVLFGFPFVALWGCF